MTKSKQPVPPVKDEAYYQEQIDYIEDALEGLRMAFSFMSGYKQFNEQRMAELENVPERSEI